MKKLYLLTTHYGDVPVMAFSDERTARALEERFAGAKVVAIPALLGEESEEWEWDENGE